MINHDFHSGENNQQMRNNSPGRERNLSLDNQYITEFKFTSRIGVSDQLEYRFLSKNFNYKQAESYLGPELKFETNIDAIDVATKYNNQERHRVSLYGGGTFNATLQLGLFPQPLIGIGPYVSVGSGTGFNSEGDMYISAELSVGAGVGTYLGYGPGVNVGAESYKELQDIHFGFGESFFAELNVGWGPSASFKIQIARNDVSANSSHTPIKALNRKLGKIGPGYGAAIAGGVTFSIKMYIPGMRRIKELGDLFSGSTLIIDLPHDYQEYPLFRNNRRLHLRD